MPAEQQSRPYLKLWIDGVLVDDAAERVHKLRVEEVNEGCSSLQLVLDLAPGDQGEWYPLDDGRFALLHRVTCAIGLGDPGGSSVSDEARLFDGYVTAVEARFGAVRVPDSTLGLHALDAAGLMHLEEKTKNWGGVSDADIVRQLYQSYGFDVDVDSSTPVRDELRGTIIQRGTDAELIQQLARRNGFEAYVEPATTPVSGGAVCGKNVIGHFHLPRVDQKSQPPLTLMPRATPSLSSLEARWESHRPTLVRGIHLDERTRRVRTSEVTAPRFARLGPTSRADIIEQRLAAVLPSQPQLQAVGLQLADVPHDAPEVENLAWRDYLRCDWLVEASGVVEALRYPTVLRARRPVDVQGAGRLLDGKWYVRRCLHRWDWTEGKQEYQVDVELVRDALNGVA